jgi:S-DNA-T family DNA segregation ATPase FtsK/SpoIIIE
MRSLQQYLNWQADIIEAVLHRHRVAAHVSGGFVAPRFVRFSLNLLLGTKVKQVAGLADEIALALGSETVRIQRRGGHVEVDVPRDSFRPLSLVSLRRQISDVPSDSALLGLDEEGHPLLVRLSSPDVAHILIAGTTGSGKTALLRTLGASLVWNHAPRDWGLVLIDPKGRGLRPLGGYPHVVRSALGTDTGSALSVLKWLVTEMERRDRLEIQRPRLAVLIDEVADLMLTGGKPVEQALARLAGRGREAGVHLVACTQKPNTAAVGSLARANFPLRLVGRVLSAEEARIAAGVKGTGAERLLGRGDFLAVTAGRTVRFQAAYVGADEVALGAKAQLARAAARHQG